MRANYETSLDVILSFEGGYSDHPSDPGGATKWGITHIALAEWRGVNSVSKIQVQGMDAEEMRAIYRARYWDACRCDELPAGIDLAVFDCAVNQGVGRAVRLLQGAARVTVDGAIGLKTLAAVRSKVAGPLLAEFCARRMVAYGSLTKLFPVFGLGWSRRLMTVHGRALAMAIEAEVIRQDAPIGRPSPGSPPPTPSLDAFTESELPES